MSAAKVVAEPLVTVEEYVEIDDASDERYEFLDGRIWAMAHESDEHGIVSFNLAGILATQLRGKPCFGMTKDTRVRSGPPGPRPFRSTSGMYSYPDIVVVCGKIERDDPPARAIMNPIVIIEVLSPSTEAFDLGKKFLRYQRWNRTLTDYVVVAQDSAWIQLATRHPDGGWTFTEYDGLDAVVPLPSIGCTLPLAEVYDHIDFPAPE